MKGREPEYEFPGMRRYNPRIGKVMPECRSCGAPIRWEKQKSGKMMPVNTTAVYVADSADDPGKRYEPGTSHFATCPNAAGHRQDTRERLQEGMEGRRGE